MAMVVLACQGKIIQPSTIQSSAMCSAEWSSISVSSASSSERLAGTACHRSFSPFFISRGGSEKGRRSGFNYCRSLRDHKATASEVEKLAADLHSRRILQRAASRILQISGSFSWFSPLLTGLDNSLPRLDELSMFSQWYSIVRRRGLRLFITAAMTALLIVNGLTNYALQPTWALTEENLVFLEAWRTVDRAYVDKSFNGQSWFRYREETLRNEPMRTREETYTAIRKMLATLDDPFTRFLEPDKFKSLKMGTNGALTGVGLEVGCDVSVGGVSEDLVVVAPVLGCPADRAGILPGDVILAIDGVITHGMGLYDAARRLQREKITLNPVSWKICEIPRADQESEKLGYIRLSTFNQNSSLVDSFQH